MSVRARASVGFVGLLAATGLLVYIVFGLFFTPGYPSVDFTQNHSANQPINLTVETVGAIGYGAHPTWVSYVVKQPNGQWIQATTWKMPAHTVVNMTVYQYDSGGPLRNQFWGSVQGVKNDSATVTSFVAGKQVGGPTNLSLINSYATQSNSDPLSNGVGHTFAIPTIGLAVPLPAVNSSSSTVCSTAAPCPESADHNVVKFSFTTPGPGNYAWQCFVPCGLGYLFGNGGPMSTINFMGGFLDVVNQ